MLLGLFSSAPTPPNPKPIQPHQTTSNDGAVTFGARHGWSKKLNGHSTSGVWKLRVEEWTGTWRLRTRVSWWLIVCSSCWRTQTKHRKQKRGYKFPEDWADFHKQFVRMRGKMLKIRKIRWAILATCICYNLDMHFWERLNGSQNKTLYVHNVVKDQLKQGSIEVIYDSLLSSSFVRHFGSYRYKPTVFLIYIFRFSMKLVKRLAFVRGCSLSQTRTPDQQKSKLSFPFKKSETFYNGGFGSDLAFEILGTSKWLCGCPPPSQFFVANEGLK